MNLNKALIAGAVGGFALSIVEFIGHGVLMADNYVNMPALFSQESGNELMLFLRSIIMGCVCGILFAKTRMSWGDGMMGGLQFGLLVGGVFFLDTFYHSMVFNGFPYWMNWAWGGINLVAWSVFGVVASALYKVEVAKAA